MAQKVLVSLVDDIDGGEAAETVTFALDGIDYDIDLSEENAARLRGVLEPYQEAGRLVAKAPAISRRAASPAATAPIDRIQAQAIRRWAAARGMDVAPRGPIPKQVVDAYNESA